MRRALVAAGAEAGALDLVHAGLAQQSPRHPRQVEHAAGGCRYRRSAAILFPYARRRGIDERERIT